MAGAGRLVGLDVARCLALLGMVATHLLPERTAAGEQSLSSLLASGRAAALFAVLAGVTVALLSGRRTPARGRSALAVAGGLAVRALLITAIGLALAEEDTGLAIILGYYGLLFLLGLPFLTLPARSLALLAGGWLVVVPVLSHLVRPLLPPRGYGNPTFGQLQDPGPLASELLFTGYYPVVPWLAYLLAGMAVGRCDLARRGVQLGLLCSGVALAALSMVLSGLLADGRFHDRTLAEIETGMFGTTPTDRWAWLLVDAPHTATPFDLAQTIGSAMAVIGLCLLVAGVLPRIGVRALAVVFGAGTMTLSLYSLHALLRTPTALPPEVPDAFGWHVALLGIIGAVFVVIGRRGPLEALVGLPGRMLRRRAGRGNPRPRPAVPPA